MNFSFGSNTSAPGQNVFGSSTFGASTQPSFGFGSTAVNTGTPGFGFGSTTTTAAPINTAVAPTFGFGGVTTNQAPQAFNFGQTASTSVAPAFDFGKSAPTTGSSIFNFGSTAAPTTTTALQFGQFGFKPATTTSSFGFGGFNTTTTSAPTLFGGFNVATTQSLFPNFGTATTTTSSFFSGFGNKTFGNSSIFQQQQQQQPQPQSIADHLLEKNETEYRSVYNCLLFGDERDVVMTKFNLLQAYWGSGRGYYSHSKPPIDYTADNIFCRFKTFAYGLIPKGEDSEGLVDLIFNKKEEDVLQQKNQIFATLNLLFGDRSTISIIFKAKRKLSESKCVLTISVQEKTATTLRTITSMELSAYLNQSNPKQQLNNLGIEAVIPRQRITEDQIKTYLSNVPNGISRSIWNKAIEENPYPNKCVPVPIIGYKELKLRKRQQETEIEHQRLKVSELVENIAAFKQNLSQIESKAADLKRTYTNLQHRALKLLCNYDMISRSGLSLQPEEEELRAQFETLMNELNGPNKFQNRFNTLSAKAKMLTSNYKCMQRVNEELDSNNVCQMNENAEKEMMKFLKEQKNGISKLVEIVRKDVNDLKTIQTALIKIANDMNHRDSN